MAIRCPSCQAGIPVADVNVAEGVALCRACNQVARLADLATSPAETAAATPWPRTPRPEGTRIELAEAGERLIVAMPRGLSRPLGFFLLCFGGFWDLISGIILVALLGDARQAPGIEPAAIPQSFDWFATIFVGGFFLAGAAILLFGVYVLTVRIALSIDRDSVTLVRSAFGREWTSVRNVRSATAVSRVVRYTQNNSPRYGIAIAFNGAADIPLGAGLGDPELAWLGGELAHALRRAGAAIP